MKSNNSDFLKFSITFTLQFVINNGMINTLSAIFLKSLDRLIFLIISTNINYIAKVLMHLYKNLTRILTKLLNQRLKNTIHSLVAFVKNIHKLKIALIGKYSRLIPLQLLIMMMVSALRN